MKKLIILSILFFAIPKFIYANDEMPLDYFIRIKQRSVIKYTALCDQKTTTILSYHEDEYGKVIEVLTKGKDIFYAINCRPEYIQLFFIKSADPDAIEEVSRNTWLKKLRIESPNYYRFVTWQDNNCIWQEK